jgi:hypothetical protein
MAKKKIFVTKATGEKEIFNEAKIRRSIRRAGIPSEIEEATIEHLQGLLYDGIPTAKVYEAILSFLGESSHPHTQARYSLKQAIMALGPSGYPFESFLAEVLKDRGYQAQTGITLEGKCAQHEIDVIALKKPEKFLIECKFHNHPGTKTDIKVALYVKARFDDVIAKQTSSTSNNSNTSGVITESWLATNTKFTPRTIKYGECSGLKLLGWNYPVGDSLRDWVEKSSLHPITCLFSLSKDQKRKLLEQDIVLCRDLAKTEKRFLKSLHFSSGTIKRVLEEARLVCN